MTKRNLVIFFFLGALSLVSIPLKKVFFRPDLTVIGYISEGDGLGRQSADLIDVFRNRFTINFLPTRKEKREKLPKRFAAHLFKKKSSFGKVIIFEDMLWRPGKNYFKKILTSVHSKSIRLAYSVWESSRLPDEWVEVLNKHFDACLVPSIFLVKVYADSGVSIPVFVLPLGLNLEKFLNEPLKKETHDPFIFGNLSACSERKNQLLLVKAFAKAFGNDPSILLKINVRYGEKQVIQSIKDEIAGQNLHNVLFTQKALSQSEYLDMFQSIDCYVSPSKGEGFSIQPREAMALGIPVVASANTGQLDICQSGLVLNLKTPNIENAIFPWGEEYGHYSNCEEESLVEALKLAKKDHEKYVKKAKEAREWARQFHYQNLEPLYLSLFQPKKIEFGERNEIYPDKIITNSEKLLLKYREIFKLN